MKISNLEIEKRLRGGTHNPSHNSDDFHILPTDRCLTCEINDLTGIGGGCLTCMGGNISDQIKNKPVEGLTTMKINDILNIIRENSNTSVIFGSYAYSAQYFPGDIDMRSIISACCTPEKVYKATEKILKKINTNLNRKRGIYFGEIKVGYDQRFMIDPKDPQFKTKITKLYNDGLLEDDEADFIMNLYDKGDKDSIDELNETFRLLYVLRWSREEIKKGSKKMRGNKKITLLDAIRQGTKIKIDLWASVQGRYIEVSNFYYMILYDPAKDIFQVLNVSPEKLNSDYITQMKAEVRKLSSPLFLNYFKMAKRMWLVARATKNKQLLDQLTPLFQGSLARLNQIKTDAETIMLILNGVKSPPYQTLIEQIDNFKTRLSYVNDIDLDFEKVYEYLDNILNNYKRYTYRFTKKMLKITNNNLDLFVKYIKEVIKKNTLAYLTSKNLYPVPSSFFSIPESSSREGEYLKQLYNKLYDTDIKHDPVGRKEMEEAGEGSGVHRRRALKRKRVSRVTRPKSTRRPKTKQQQSDDLIVETMFEVARDAARDNDLTELLSIIDMFNKNPVNRKLGDRVITAINKGLGGHHAYGTYT
jgi:hypothetical protein